jgi:hypothetical protein
LGEPQTAPIENGRAGAVFFFRVGARHPTLIHTLDPFLHTAGGTLKLAYPSTQQQLLVWKTPPRR